MVTQCDTDKAYMDIRVKDFMIQKFGKKLLKKLSSDNIDEFEEFRTAMYTLLFSHRHAKVENNLFLKQINKHLSSKGKKQLDFSTVRNPAYFYNLLREREYFRRAIWSFLMVYFAEN